MAFKKMPRNVQRWITKHNLLVDLMCMMLTYWTLGGTVTALIAGALVDIIISGMLHVAQHPEDFVWLFDLIGKVKQTFAEMGSKLKGWNEEYKKKHPEASSTPSPLFGNVNVTEPMGAPV